MNALETEQRSESNSGLHLYGVRDSFASQANMVSGAQMDTKVSDRLRTPQYAHSDALDIGYSYPWVRPPVEMYNLPLDNYEGFTVRGLARAN